MRVIPGVVLFGVYLIRMLILILRRKIKMSEKDKVIIFNNQKIRRV